MGVFVCTPALNLFGGVFFPGPLPACPVRTSTPSIIPHSILNLHHQLLHPVYAPLHHPQYHRPQQGVSFLLPFNTRSA
ncbi:hypothetical protein GGR58DRAFT_7371 [Xylaria digitata]|nr:hypothetical protein GGR58DRAFT_7371 [Xylaria digitata]